MSLVSVIIPTYNRPRLVVEAIHSVLAQTYPEFEIIVVNDGSSGETAAAVGSIHDPRLIYLYQENAGRSAARNRGLQAARGEFIGFLDDDDLYLPDKLALEVAFLEAHPEIDLVGSGGEFRRRNESGGAVWRPWEHMPEPTFLQVLYSCPFLTCGVLFRPCMLDKLDPWFDVELKRAEDSDFFIRLAFAGCRMAWLEEVLSVYRDHEGRNITSVLHSDSYHIKMLDKFFARADLPGSVREHSSNVYRRYYLFSACRYFSCRVVSGGQRSLLHAWLQHQGSSASFASAFTERVVWMAKEPMWLGDPIPFIDFVFSHLPSPLAWLESWHQTARDSFTNNTGEADYSLLKP